jgi:hypothetical protein
MSYQQGCRPLMKNYFSKRKKSKLYNQWVEKSGLSPDNVPEELEGKSDLPETPDDNAGEPRQDIRSGFTFHLTLHHLLYLLLIIVALLIATVSLATVLIMRSC